MRVTNKIIQNNSLTNINVNKTLQDKLSTMLSTEKKIARPSEDPIVALRSLRLRTSVNQTAQYVEKNVEDAKSWLTVTEDAIDTLTDIITDVRKQYVKGTSETLQPADRKIILENLEALAQEVYNTGNADFAGRSVFTGYRTETTLTFQKQEDIKYSIDENENTVTRDSITYINQADSEYDVYTKEINRIRLSYDNLDNTNPKLKVDDTEKTVTIASLSTNPYKTAAEDKDAILFVPETGEILFGENTVPAENAKIEITYEKEKWKKGDLRPEHYFNCIDKKDNITYSSHSGEIEYNIGVNQYLRINTNADECFMHDIVRDLQDTVNALNEQIDIEKTISNIEAELAGYDGTQTAEISDANKRLDAAKKAKTFIDEKLSKLLGANITNADEYMNRNSVALTNCGTRSKRLELIENRLDTQLASLKELKSENEDADIAETAIRLTSAGYAYDASLMSTAKIMKESLLNYI